MSLLAPSPAYHIGFAYVVCPDDCGKPFDGVGSSNFGTLFAVIIDIKIIFRIYFIYGRILFKIFR